MPRDNKTHSHEGPEIVDAAIVAGGIAGLSAALFLARAGRSTIVYDALCDVDDAGFAKTDEHGRTSRPGVFAIGNATNPIAHPAHAAASGTEVGPWVTMHLLESLLSDRRSA